MTSEFQFINNIREKFRLSNVGDDCAVLPKDDNSDLLITADLLVENVDFRLDWANPADIGYRSLAVSLSDIAAVGGMPVWGMASLGVPEKLWKIGFPDGFYVGWHELAAEFGVELIGGDISRTSDGLVIDSIVLGEVPKGRAIHRSSAKPGDAIFVSGTLGGSAAGLQMLESGKVDRQHSLIQKHLRPCPQVTLAKQLRTLGIVSSMIDISDGLSSDLEHICHASGVGAIIDEKCIPFHPNLVEEFPNGDERTDLVLNGGEDFELLFTIPTDGVDLLVDIPVTRIGEITSSGKLELQRNGSIEEIPAAGFRHF
jgi:thiamine-monophosphate kinase